MGTTRRTIKVDTLARVEGEGALYVRVTDGAVAEVRLKIYEPPRFFEAFLRGRRFTEAPDITARICGICPVAYQMSACQAMESAAGVTVDARIRALRRLLYLAEWIESHTLHIYMLHAPDFLGFPGVVEMAGAHPETVTRALRLKKVGNDLMAAIGGREIHPVNVRVGGFYRAPGRDELAPFAARLREAREIAVETVRWVAGFEFPAIERDYEFVALTHPDEYAILEGRLAGSRGLDIAVREYEQEFTEEQRPYSNALHSRRRSGESYLVGPLARYSLNFDRLTPLAQDAARRAGLGPVCRNPFRSIIVRAVELTHACDEALTLVQGYAPPDPPAVDVPARAGTGWGCTEAPRGILYHRYHLDAAGTILAAKIVPPTSQNQATIEDDLRDVVGASLDLPDDRLTWRCEQTVRNYDPCISCATHFLTVRVDRERPA
ncbi:MAG TPA: Ni/Fe hydrogenase subunit alpha [bacterium]|nr:Ni/Fe hydrogenase subunit alpha [bacterium]